MYINNNNNNNKLKRTFYHTQYTYIDRQKNLIRPISNVDTPD